jgi:hypothetical protein
VIVYFAGACTVPLLQLVHDYGVTAVLVGWRNVRKRNFDKHAPFLEGRQVLLDPGYGDGGRPEEYLAFARDYQELFDGCLAWDVPGASALVNTHWFLWCGSAGLPKMVPVFHPGMPWRYLGAMQAVCGRVALGGLLRFPILQRMAYLDEAFFLPDGSLRNPGLRAHGLGMDHPQIVARYPWDSVDAMTWLNPIRFGKDGTVAEAIRRQGDKGKAAWKPIGRPRWLMDPAHELAHGVATCSVAPSKTGTEG